MKFINKKYVISFIIFFGSINYLFAQNENDFKVKQLPNNTLEITGYIGSTKNVRIPEILFGLKVVSIGLNAFLCDGIESVIIPNTVIEIKANAFFGNKLKSIDIPASVQVIGFAAFYDNQINKIIIPSTVKIIEPGAFEKNQITSVSIKPILSKIGTGAFDKNPLTSISIPNNSTENMIKGAFEEGFYNYWINQNRAGGTYVKKNGAIWTREEEQVTQKPVSEKIFN